MSTLLRGIILGLSITAPVGPTNIEVIRRGVRDGWRSAAAFCSGVMVALVIYLVLVVFGLSALAESEIFNIFPSNVKRPHKLHVRPVINIVWTAEYSVEMPI